MGRRVLITGGAGFIGSHTCLVLLEPFRIADWWLVVRLERYAPATFTDEVSDQMCQEMFDIWVDQETTDSLSQLGSETSEPASTSGFIDFSISR